MRSGGSFTHPSVHPSQYSGAMKTSTRVWLLGGLALVTAATVVEPTLAFGTVPVVIAVGTALIVARRPAPAPAVPVAWTSVAEG